MRKCCLIVEPPVFREVEKEVGKLIDKFTTPARNIVKYVILNREAYQELVDYYAEWYQIELYSDTIMDYPIVLDMDAKERVRVLSNCYTEFKLRSR
ncbi:MAG: hypothetical protein WCX48_09495 [Bacteroidales bacterium]